MTGLANSKRLDGLGISRLCVLDWKDPYVVIVTSAAQMYALYTLIYFYHEANEGVNCVHYEIQRFFLLRMRKLSSALLSSSLLSPLHLSASSTCTNKTFE